MLERLVEMGANGLVRVVSAGRLKLERNPVFTQEMNKIQEEKRSLATRIYDSGTVLIIDDSSQTLIPKFIVRRR